ncbi:MAG: 50S ribosomal protein L4 [Chitinophagales bacterium]|nr:50S ribosomal protein L4 [Chitinophagales bacterium]
MKLKVVDISGKETGKEVSLSKDIFGIEPNDHAIYLAVKHYMASKRSGNHKTKERSEIKGSTRKIKRQKGTGTARAGNIKNPLFKGGGRVFGPRVRDYDFKLNKKVNTLAKKSALTYKAKDSNIMVVDKFSMENAKTKDFVSFLSSIGVAENKTTIVASGDYDNAQLSSRNIPNTKMIDAADINAYEILDCEKLILSVDAVNYIEDKLSDNNE